RIAPRHRRHLPAHADADVARPGARRPDHPYGLPDHPAAGRLRSDRARPRSAQSGVGAGQLGDPQPAQDRPRARTIRQCLQGQRQGAAAARTIAPWACPVASHAIEAAAEKRTANNRPRQAPSYKSQVTSPRYKPKVEVRSMRVYYDRDADLNLIKGKKVAIIGYGSQGHAHALNLRDSGVKDVAVALRKTSQGVKKAQGEKLPVMEVAEAAKWADVMMMLTPDELQADIYTNHLHGNMKQGAALMFAHGLNNHFNLIEPRSDLDVMMIAPKGPGHTVRSEYQRGAGVPCLLAIHRDVSGNAHDLCLSYGAAIGGGRAGII